MLICPVNIKKEIYSNIFFSYNKKSYVATYVDYGRTMHNTTFLDNKTNTQKSVYDYMKER